MAFGAVNLFLIADLCFSWFFPLHLEQRKLEKGCNLKFIEQKRQKKRREAILILHSNEGGWGSELGRTKVGLKFLLGYLQKSAFGVMA